MIGGGTYDDTFFPIPSFASIRISVSAACGDVLLSGLEAGTRSGCEIVIGPPPCGIAPTNCHPLQVTPLATRITFDSRGQSQVIWFRGTLSLSDGDQSSDFRQSLNSGFGALRVTMGTNSPVTVYCNDHLSFCVSGVEDCSETWFYEKGPSEEAIFRFDDDQQYIANNDPNLPVSAATGHKNVGNLETTFISQDST